MTANHWDPLPHERTYYRNARSGDLGWMVRRDGRDHIKLDRPAQEIVMPFSPEQWELDREYRPLQRMHFVQVAFEADRALCKFLGLHELARRKWLDLREEERMRYAADGPSGAGGRRELFSAIIACLEQHGGR